MVMIRRTLEETLARVAGAYPVVFLTGPRQSGKTTLCRMTFPGFAYVSLEEMQRRREAQEDPRGFLGQLAAGGTGVILDEAQRAPELFSYLQGFVDEGRGGPYILTGSAQFLLLEKITQSLAGRTAILELLPFSMAELEGRPARRPQDLFVPPDLQPATDRTLDDVLFGGMFPRIHDRGLDPSRWYDGYIRTYIERDVRAVSGIGDLDTFTRFVALCAGRSGQLVNLSSLASDTGVSHVTAKRWISVLRTSYVVELLQPHHENFSKRVIKSPKLHFSDPGLLCHLLGVRRVEDLRAHPLRGSIFESFVVSEFRKLFLHQGERPPLFFWRNSGGHEVDLIVETPVGRVPVEMKSGLTVASDALNGLDYYTGLSGGTGGLLVYGGDEEHRRRQHLIRSWRICT